MLDFSNKSNEITEWLVYFAQTILKGQQYTQEWIRFIIEKTKFYDRVIKTLNPRQAKVIARLLQEGPNGFQGGLSGEKYIRITGTSRATATRDLQHLEREGVCHRTGQLKQTRYTLNMQNTGWE